MGIDDGRGGNKIIEDKEKRCSVEKQLKKTKGGFSHPERPKSLWWTALICLSFPYFCHQRFSAVPQKTSIPSIKVIDKREHKFGIEKPGSGIEGT